MTIVLCEPGKIARIEEIEEGLDSYQKIVGGLIQAVYPYDDPVAVICNDEGKLLGLPMNRGLKRGGKLYDILCGTFFVCGLGEEDFCGLSDELAEKYLKVFFYPERFLRNVMVTHLPEDE